MKNILLITFSCFTCSCLFGQQMAIGLGFEVNQTRVRQQAPTVDTDFSNPHKPGIGLSAHSLVKVTIADIFFISLKPKLSILKTRSDVTSRKQFEFFSLSTEVGYIFGNGIFVNGGVEYSYLIRMLSKFNGPYGNWTFFANRRNFLHPTLGVGYKIDHNASVHINFEYFVRDVFNSGALDYDGNIVGPVMIYPYTIGIGCTYEFGSPRRSVRTIAFHRWLDSNKAFRTSRFATVVQ